MTNVDRGTSLEEAERQATAINAFWAERGGTRGRELRLSTTTEESFYPLAWKVI